MSRALFTSLVDDAAVFPPGNAPLPIAVLRHRVHRASPYADLVGPLLVPASAAAELGDLVPTTDPVLRIGVVARPGTPADTVTGALDTLRDHPTIEVAGLELGWTPQWRQARPAGMPVVLELPRGTDQQRALDDIAAIAALDLAQADTGVVAKFRTGATATWPWPDEDELARVLRAVVDHGVRFKLTGGLHHAVRGTHDSPGGTAGDEQHGLLNVLLATHAAVDGADVPALRDLLSQRDADPLARRVAALTHDEVVATRRHFTAYGCCGVTDPIDELTTLGLIGRSSS